MFRSILQRVPSATHPQPVLQNPFVAFSRLRARGDSLPASKAGFVFLRGGAAVSRPRYTTATRRVQQVFSTSVMAAPSDAFSGREWKDGEAHEVLPKVFLGSMEAAKDKESLKSHGVTHILTVNGKDPAFKDDFEYKDINFGGDNGNLTQYLDDSMKFVDSGVEAGGVLIHCTHGTGRSAAMTIAATMKTNGEGAPGGVGSFTEAFRLVKSRRPGTDPPLPFQQELSAWEESQSA